MQKSSTFLGIPTNGEATRLYSTIYSSAKHMTVGKYSTIDQSCVKASGSANILDSTVSNHLLPNPPFNTTVCSNENHVTMAKSEARFD